MIARSVGEGVKSVRVLRDCGLVELMVRGPRGLCCDLVDCGNRRGWSGTEEGEFDVCEATEHEADLEGVSPSKSCSSRLGSPVGWAGGCELLGLVVRPGSTGGICFDQCTSKDSGIRPLSNACLTVSIASCL